MLRRARALLAALPGTTLTAESGLYVTAPVGGPEQDDYFNQVVELSTTLSPYELLAATQGIEAELGRVREIRWGPRTIDVDILWYHGFSSAEACLGVPHPRMEQRRFVLEPLAELAPDLVLPSGRTMTEALAGVQDQDVRRIEDGAAGAVSGQDGGPCNG
jgi:2-amino-4-hydroxy-6-hydroxymethyldihydropteridine diphosphokinase